MITKVPHTTDNKFYAFGMRIMSEQVQAWQEFTFSALSTNVIV